MLRQLTFDPDLDKLCTYCWEHPAKTKNLCQRCYDRQYHQKHHPKASHNASWFRKRVVEKYGPEIIDDLEAIKTRQYWTLQNVADKHGFSREYARQLFNKLFGKSTTPFIKQKALAREKDIALLGCPNDPRHKAADYVPGRIKRGANIELIVFNKCLELGYDVNVSCNKTIDLIVNNFNVDVKSSNKTSRVANKKSRALKHCSEYFHFGCRPHQYAKCDFFVCYAIPIDTFWILPQKAMGQYGVYIRANDQRYRSFIPESIDYDYFENAWHLLSKPPQENIPTKPAEKSNLTGKEHRRKYYLKNREKILATKRERYRQNKEAKPQETL